MLRFREAVLKIKGALIASGYPSFTLEDFHDTVSVLLQLLSSFTLDACVLNPCCTIQLDPHNGSDCREFVVIYNREYC